MNNYDATTTELCGFKIDGFLISKFYVEYRYQKRMIFLILNPIPTDHGRNQPIYERHVTKSGRNRVKHYDQLNAYHSVCTVSGNHGLLRSFLKEVHGVTFISIINFENFVDRLKYRLVYYYPY